MDGRGRTFFLLQVFFCFFVFASTEETKQNCSQVPCPGPLSYYHEMGCTPVYKNEGDCCAYKYNCDHLDTRSPNKCYIKHRSYEIGEFVNREEINKYDLTCVCAGGRNSSRFWCYYSSYHYEPRTGYKCYIKRNIHESGPGTIICPKNVSEIPECHVDGRKYRGGEIFKPLNEPQKRCICQEGYTGNNTEQFCITLSSRCNTDLYYDEEIANKSAPIYNSYRNPATSCTTTWRSQNAYDTVIPNPNGPTASEVNSAGGEGLTCKFGNLTMNIGDKLSRSTDPRTYCARCVCEVPPTPTCGYLGHDECYYGTYSTNI